MFVLGGEEWCVPVTDVREVLPWQRPTRLADPRPTLRGIVRVRDDLLAVHDVGSLFGGSSGAEGAILVLEGGERPVGIAVDATRDVLPPLPLAPAPAGGEVVAGIVAAGDRTIVAVEVAKLLATLGEKPRPRPRALRRAPKKA